MSVLGDAAQAVASAVMGRALALAPDSWLPGGVPDPLIEHRHGIIGTQVARLDGPAKVGGTAAFAAEVALPGMAYAALVFSTVPRGRITQMDLAAAEAAQGVVLVMTYRNAPRMKPLPYFLSAPKACAGDSLPVMQDDEIHWNGQPVALVLAETQEQADHAATLITVGYARTEAVTGFEAARLAATELASFAGEKLLHETGDAEAALAQAAVRVDQTYLTPRHNHNALEPHAATVVWDGDTLTVHDATQCVGHEAWSLGEAFGIDESAVRVLSPFVGGGFGGKTLWQHQLLAAAAARLARRPVRLALSREAVYRLVGGRTLTQQRVAIGADADGTFRALVHTGVVAMGGHNNVPEPFIRPATVLYAVPSMRLWVQTTRMDMLANTFMRAPGEAVGSFALESAIDELAEALGMDPVELRALNEPQTEPASGLPFSARHLVQATRDGAERFGWARRGRPGTVRDGEWQVGLGVATATYPYHRMPGGAARITLSATGALVEVAAHEMGMGTATTTAMVASARLGLRLDQIEVRQGDSTLPGMVLAGGSQQTASIGAGLIAAHRALTEALLKLAGNDSPLAGLAAADVGTEDGGLCALADPQRWESYASILSRAGQDCVVAEAEAQAPLEVKHWSMHSTGAVFSEVRVNAVTGETRVSRMLGSFDCGRIINPRTAASQFRGGMIMGLGMALMEQTEFDERSGRVVNASLAEYHVPVHMDVPQIEVMWTDIADPHAPMGARGVGEIGIVGVAASIANAVFNATGKRVRSLPITLDRML